MNYFDIIGWIGTIFFIFGCTALANKSKLGFWCNGLGNLAYAMQSIIRPNISLLILSIFLICINIYGIYNWRIKKGKWKLGYTNKERDLWL